MSKDARHPQRPAAPTPRSILPCRSWSGVKEGGERRTERTTAAHATLIRRRGFAGARRGRRACQFHQRCSDVSVAADLEHRRARLLRRGARDVRSFTSRGKFRAFAPFILSLPAPLVVRGGSV